METHQIKVEKTPVRDLFLRTIAVLGLIAILLLGAWGIIQLAFAIPSVFGNLGSSVSSLFTHNTTTNATSTKEAMIVTVPATLVSGDTLTVSWMHRNAASNTQYAYAVSYACQDGLTVKAPLPTGNYQSVPCNTLFNYVKASEQMKLVPTISGSTNVPLTVTIVATKLSTGLVSVTGTATSNIVPATGTTKPATPVKTTKPVTSTSPSTAYYPAATRATNLYGYGDLSTTINSVAPSANGLTVIKFTVANVGTNTVNAGWTFNATLPINGSYTFGSQAQQALYPGDKIVYTLSFAGINRATNTYGNAQPYGYSYQTSGYTANGYTCNGYTCGNTSYPTYTNSNTNTYPYNTYNYGYQAQSATVTITADPLNFVQEYNKGNNTAQTTVQLY